jgi:hypothetical protein
MKVIMNSSERANREPCIRITMTCCFCSTAGFRRPVYGFQAKNISLEISIAQGDSASPKIDRADLIANTGQATAINVIAKVERLVFSEVPLS